jgi:hypothetical protein
VKVFLLLRQDNCPNNFLSRPQIFIPQEMMWLVCLYTQTFFRSGMPDEADSFADSQVNLTRRTRHAGQNYRFT